MSSVLGKNFVKVAGADNLSSFLNQEVTSIRWPRSNEGLIQ